MHHEPLNPQKISHVLGVGRCSRGARRCGRACLSAARPGTKRTTSSSTQYATPARRERRTPASFLRGQERWGGHLAAPLVASQHPRLPSHPGSALRSWISVAVLWHGVYLTLRRDKSSWPCVAGGCVLECGMVRITIVSLPWRSPSASLLSMSCGIFWRSSHSSRRGKVTNLFV